MPFLYKSCYARLTVVTVLLSSYEVMLFKLVRFYYVYCFMRTYPDS